MTLEEAIRRARAHARIGVLPITPAPEPSAKPQSLGDAVRQITPTLLLVGIATGFAFAIGNGIASRYVFGRKS